MMPGESKEAQDAKHVASMRRTATDNPTSIYRPTGTGAGWGWGMAALDGKPFYTWFDVPRMIRDPRVRFLERMWRSPFQQATWTVKATHPKVQQYVDSQLKKFWRESLPALLQRYFWFGFAPGGAEFSQRKGLVRLDGVRPLEPLDARPLLFHGGPHDGRMAGLEFGTTKVYLPHAFWFSGEKRFGPYYDMPPAGGMFEPWAEKRGRNGAIDMRRTWFHKNSSRGIVVRHPPGRTESSDEFPGGRDNQSIARELIDYSETNSSLTLTNEKHPSDPSHFAWEVEWPESFPDRAGFREYPKDLDAEMAEGVGIPREVLEAAATGSGYSGRQIPLQAWLGGVDEYVGMLLRSCEWLKWAVMINFGPNAYFEVETESLVKKLLEDSKGPGGMGGAVQNMVNPQPQPGGDAQGKIPPGMVPHKGPRGGGGYEDPNTGRRRYLSDERSPSDELSEEQIARRVAKMLLRKHREEQAALELSDGRTPDLATHRKQLLVLLAMLEFQRRAHAVGDSASSAPYLEALTQYLKNPNSLRYPLELSWRADETRTGHIRAVGEAEHAGRVLYGARAEAALRAQEGLRSGLKPGERAPKTPTPHANRDQWQKAGLRAREILAKVAGYEHTPEDLQELGQHLPYLPMDRLMNARSILRAKFKGARGRLAQVGALMDHIREQVGVMDQKATEEAKVAEAVGDAVPVHPLDYLAANHGNPEAMAGKKQDLAVHDAINAAYRGEFGPEMKAAVNKGGHWDNHGGDIAKRFASIGKAIAESRQKPKDQPAAPQEPPKKPEDSAVEYVRAKAGGEVSPVDGKHYAGGQLMPIHGLSPKVEKKPPQGGEGGGPAKANEDAEHMRTTLKPGDTVYINGDTPITVKKANKATVTTELGSTWKYSELTPKHQSEDRPMTAREMVDLARGKMAEKEKGAAEQAAQQVPSTPPPAVGSIAKLAGARFVVSRVGEDGTVWVKNDQGMEWDLSPRDLAATEFSAPEPERPAPAWHEVKREDFVQGELASHVASVRATVESAKSRLRAAINDKGFKVPFGISPEQYARAHVTEHGRPDKDLASAVRELDRTEHNLELAKKQQAETKSVIGTHRLTHETVHRNLVSNALASGKHVPAEVLADYPDLAAKKAAPSSPQDTQPPSEPKPATLAGEKPPPTPKASNTDSADDVLERMRAANRPKPAKDVAAAFKGHVGSGRKDVALKVMNDFRSRASVNELREFADSLGIGSQGTRNQIGERLVAYAVHGRDDALKEGEVQQRRGEREKQEAKPTGQAEPERTATAKDVSPSAKPAAAPPSQRPASELSTEEATAELESLRNKYRGPGMHVLSAPKPGSPEYNRDDDRQTELQERLGKMAWQRRRDAIQNVSGMPPEKHRKYVEQALASGKPVPPEVLADYPDLAAKYTTQPAASDSAVSPPASPPPPAPPVAASPAPEEPEKPKSVHGRTPISGGKSASFVRHGKKAASIGEVFQKNGQRYVVTNTTTNYVSDDQIEDQGSWSTHKDGAGHYTHFDAVPVENTDDERAADDAATAKRRADADAKIAAQKRTEDRWGEVKDLPQISKEMLPADLKWELVGDDTVKGPLSATGTRYYTATLPDGSKVGKAEHHSYDDYRESYYGPPHIADESELQRAHSVNRDHAKNRELAGTEGDYYQGEAKRFLAAYDRASPERRKKFDEHAASIARIHAAPEESQLDEVRRHYRETGHALDRLWMPQAAQTAFDQAGYKLDKWAEDNEPESVGAVKGRPGYREANKQAAITGDDEPFHEFVRGESEKIKKERAATKATNRSMFDAAKPALKEKLAQSFPEHVVPHIIQWMEDEWVSERKHDEKRFEPDALLADFRKNVLQDKRDWNDDDFKKDYPELHAFAKKQDAEATAKLKSAQEQRRKEESKKPSAKAAGSSSEHAYYNGKPYKVLYVGPTKFGKRARLQFLDGSKDFWVDAHKVQLPRNMSMTKTDGEPAFDPAQAELDTGA